MMEPYPFRSERAQAEYLALYSARARLWPVPSETRFVEIPSGKTFVRLSGDPANPPLVLLPGSRSNSLQWIPNIAALSSHYCTYALDCIYDIGLSVAGRRLTNRDDLVNWLCEVLAVLVSGGGLRLIGNSYGGWLAGRYALRFPEQLQKLVLISPAATVLPASVPFILRAFSLLLPGTLAIRKFLDWLLQDTLQSGEAGRAVVERAVEEWVVAKRSFGPLPLISANVLTDPELRSLHTPTLFLVGEHEKVYSAPKAVERLKRVAPQIQTELIPHAGHDVWIVQAERVNRSLLRFLDDPV